MQRFSILKNILAGGFIVCLAGLPAHAQETESDPYVQHLVLKERILLNKEGGPVCTIDFDLEFLSEEAHERYRAHVREFNPEAMQLSPAEKKSESERIGKPVTVNRQFLEEAEKSAVPPHKFFALNRAVIQTAFEVNDDVSFITAAARYRDALQESYRRDAGNLLKEFPDAVSFNYDYILRGKVLDTGRIYQTYRLESTTYTGGAHPLTMVRYFNFLNGKEINIAEAFGENVGKKLEKLLLECLMEQEGVNRVSQLEALSYFPDRFFVSENFYCTDDACVFVYNPYDIAPYSRGLVEISVPYSKLRKAGLR